jgi:hypothetical protein
MERDSGRLSSILLENSFISSVLFVDLSAVLSKKI